MKENAEQTTETDTNTAKTVTFTIAGRTYRVIPVLQNWEKDEQHTISWWRLLRRADRLCANLTEEEGEHILDFQDEIPPELAESRLIFSEWEYYDVGDPGADDSPHHNITAVIMKNGLWKRVQIGITERFGQNDRLVQRIPYGMK